MYEIRPESIKTFITDRNVRLPRFQRKQTWDERKNFQLCISIFKEYPIGVTILSVEESKGRTVRWLLDGRQRRNALQAIMEDPENIYTWARKFIGIKNSDQPSEIEDKFRTKINEYIEAEEDEEIVAIPTNDDDDTSEPAENLEEIDGVDVGGLPLLLDIIKLIHNKKGKTSGFTKPFDFSAYVSKLPYYETVDGFERLSSRKVKTFIDEYRTVCYQDSFDYSDSQSFLAFLDRRATIDNEGKLKAHLSAKWKDILVRIEMIEKIDNLLSNSKIGVIEVKNLSPADSQKIFNIINTEGEKLTAVEVLSAKPHWNVKIANPSQEALMATKAFYKKIGIEQEDVVRWDLAATFVKRLGANIVWDEFPDTKSGFEKELSMGFKILSGIYTQGVKKDNIDKLGKINSINWDSDVDGIVHDLKTMMKLIETSSYFKYFKSWRTPIMSLTSDAVALDFLLIAYLDWRRKGKPVGTDLKARQFQKNCFILWDRLVYEYVNTRWRGAADQKIANNIIALEHENDLFSPVEPEKWTSLLEQIFADSQVELVDISFNQMKPLLFHAYCLSEIDAPGAATEFEVDHIIPQALFQNSMIPRNDVIQHNLLNLGLLPARENASKGKRRLCEITDSWLKEQILKYEFIGQNDYADFSNVSNYKTMFDLRKPKFTKAFNGDRNKALSN